MKFLLGCFCAVAGIGLMLFVFFGVLLEPVMATAQSMDISAALAVVIGVVGFAVFMVGKFLLR